LTTAIPPSFWRERLAPYARPSLRLGLLDLVTSAIPYLLLSGGMYALLEVSDWLTLALAVPAAGFLVRTFIVFHDCAHGSFLPNRAANRYVGRACAFLVFSAFGIWRHEHALHHATAGDLDQRGMGDVHTLTVEEYRALSPVGRLGYRLLRNPLVLLVFGPLWALVLQPRLIPAWARRRFWREILLTDMALASVLAGLCVLVGWSAVLLVQLPPALLAGAAGIWLFYVQHQFEGVYWDRHDRWSHADSALLGSSYLKLPRILQFFTGNIGFHHVHHMNPRIPNYNLQRAHDDIAIFHEAPTLTLWDGIRALRLKLYDEQSARLVGFSAAKGKRSPEAGRALPVAGPAPSKAGRTLPSGS
jgi:omega-6 fatty acid desaturase (delta-12 desaturase)